MMWRCVLLYFFCLTIPLALGASVWQSIRYTRLEREVKDLEIKQVEMIDKNIQAITVIANFSSPGRIEKIAREDLGLSKIQPENVLQIRIGRRTGRDG